MATPPPSSLPRSSLYRVEAIVLRHRYLGEADRLLTLYTREHGKLRATVRAARKITSRLGGHVEPLTHASLLLVRGRTLDSVTQAQALETFPNLRGDLLSTARGLHAAGLVDLFTEEQEPQPALFDLLLDTLRRLDGTQHQAGDSLLRAFEVQLLEAQGYRPVLDRCASCGGPAPGPSVAFGAAWGGILCDRCRAGQEGTRSLSPEALRYLLALQRRGFGALSDSSLIAAAPWHEVEGLLRWYLSYLLERPLETATFLDALRERAPS